MTHHYLYQVLRETYQVGVVCDHVLVLLAQRLLRIYSRFQVPFFGVVGVHLVEVGHWEAGLHDVVYVLFWRVEKLSYVFVAFSFMVFAIMPGFDCLTVPLNHHEVSIQQQDDFVLHLFLVELDRNRLRAFIVEGI